MSLESIRSRNKGGALDKFLKAAAKTSMGKATNNDNEREETYYPERDKLGNGSAIIRFLPGLDSEDNPYYVERFQHGFEHNKKWYIEFCPTTLNDKCPVCDYNQEMRVSYGQWDDCPVEVQDLIKKRGRNRGFRSGFYTNIKVIKDPSNPENEGKYFLFNFGKGIMDMILEKVHPSDDLLGEIPDPVDVFNLMTGCNFKFIIRKKDGRADYGKSSFEESSEVEDFKDEEQTALLPLINESIFKSYEELTKRFNYALGEKAVTGTAEEALKKEQKETAPEHGSKEDIKAAGEKAAKATAESAKKLEEAVEASKGGDTDEDDNMAYFNDIADEIKI